MRNRTSRRIGLIATVCTAAVAACVSNSQPRAAYPEPSHNENTVVNNPPPVVNAPARVEYNTSAANPQPSVNNNTTVVTPPAAQPALPYGGGPVIIDEGRRHRRGIVFHRHD